MFSPASLIMPRNRPDRRRIKVHRSYTVDEAARTLGIAKGTVRRWLKNGLCSTDHRKPALIRGSDLADFLKSKAKTKQPCPPGHCYCVKCRSSQKPDGAFAEYIVLTATSGNLRAICPTCGNLMHRRTSAVQLELIRAELDVTIVEKSPRLRDSRQPSTIDHLQEA
jgi:excisionase family DNA binding protein